VKKGQSEVADFLLKQLGDFSQHMPLDIARGLIVTAAAGGGGTPISSAAIYQV